MFAACILTYGQTAKGLVLALNGMPTSLVVWHMSVCSLNRQNISLGWHRCGGIEGRAHDHMSPRSLTCLWLRDSDVFRGCSQFPCRDQIYVNARRRCIEGVFVSLQSQTWWGQLAFDLVHLESSMSFFLVL